MDRRNFCQLLLMGAVGSQMATSVLAQAYNYSQSGIKYKSSYLVNAFGEGTSGHSLRVFDIFSEKLTIIPIDFFPHTVIRISENLIVSTEKYGVKAAIVDIKKGKIIHSHTYSAEDQMQYMGHCLFDPSKGVVYTTEQIFSTPSMNDFRRGVVNERDPFTWEILKTHDSFGYSPHDMTFTSTGQIALCNSSDRDLGFDKGGSFFNTENRNVALINPKDFSLIKRIAMPNTFFCPTHIKPYQDSLVVSGIYSHSRDIEFHWTDINWNPIVIDKEGNTKELLQDPYVKKLMNAEHLSIAVNENLGVVAVTIPWCNCINLWSLKDNRFLAQLNFTLPVGIVVHPISGDFIVLTDKGLYSVNPVTFQDKSLGMNFMGNDMSHSYVI